LNDAVIEEKVLGCEGAAPSWAFAPCVEGFTGGTLRGACDSGEEVGVLLLPPNQPLGHMLKLLVVEQPVVAPMAANETAIQTRCGFDIPLPSLAKPMRVAEHRRLRQAQRGFHLSIGAAEAGNVAKRKIMPPQNARREQMRSVYQPVATLSPLVHERELRRVDATAKQRISLHSASLVSPTHLWSSSAQKPRPSLVAAMSNEGNGLMQSRESLYDPAD
jgi:hypothetical protein